MRKRQPIPGEGIDHRFVGRDIRWSVTRALKDCERARLIGRRAGAGGLARCEQRVRHESDEQPCRYGGVEEAPQPIPSCNDSRAADVLDEVDADRQVQEDHRRQPWVEKALQHAVGGNAVHHQLAEIEQHGCKAEPDGIGEEEGQTVEHHAGEDVGEHSGELIQGKTVRQIACLQDTVHDGRLAAGEAVLFELVDVLWDNLEQGTLAKLSVSGICAQTGLNRNSFYYHFDDLRDLARTAVEDTLERDLPAIMLAQVGAGASGLAQLDDEGRVIFEFCLGGVLSLLAFKQQGGTNMTMGAMLKTDFAQGMFSAMRV